MRVTQSINASTMVATLVAASNSMGKFGDLPESWPCWLLALFVVLLRVKFFADDHAHFERVAENPSVFNRLGLLCAIIAWVAFIGSAGMLGDYKVAGLWLMYVFVACNLWILIGLYREQQVADKPKHAWEWVNAAYTVLLGLIVAAEPLAAIWMISEKLLLVFAFLALFITLIGDFIGSKSLAKLEK
jgi:hypothetical protein